MVRDNGLTSDIPYDPSFPDPRDAAEVRFTTRSGSQSKAPDRDEQPGKGRSYAPPIAPSYQKKLDELQAKLGEGQALSDSDIELLTQMAAINLLTASRPSVRITAAKLLSVQREKKLALKTEPPLPAGAEPPPAQDSSLNTP